MPASPSLVLLLACTGARPGSDGLDSGAAPTDVDLSPLSLTWTPSATGIDEADLRRGIDWNLSLLGALPPADGAHLEIDATAVPWSLTLDLQAAAFPPAAHAALTDALAEVRAHGAPIDVGRLFMLSLHEPWRYYAITGACPDLASWQAARRPAQTDRYDVTTSLLSGGDRVVLLPPAEADIAAVAFLVATSTGELGVDWAPEEFETVDLMANGQQRFAAYDHRGGLEPAADEAVVAAGQPGKCQWCHEGHLMPGAPSNPSTADAIPTADWLSRIEAWQAALDQWRAGLGSSVDWVDPQAHTQGELVVREFLLPTLDRAAAEWGLDEAGARELIEAEGLSPGPDEEWPQRGEVLTRAEVDAVQAARTGQAPLPVLADARELEPGAALRGEHWAAWLDCGAAD